jgi:MFS family permease
MAPYIGRLADKGSHSRVRFIALGLVLLSIGLMITCPLNVAVLVVAVLLLDVGAQSIQVTNTTLIYSLDDTSYSRINTIYMTSFFTGGALGTVAGIVAWQYAGWLGVNLQMLLWALVELFLMYREKRIKSKDQIQ